MLLQTAREAPERGLLQAAAKEAAPENVALWTFLLDRALLRVLPHRLRMPTRPQPPPNATIPPPSVRASLLLPPCAPQHVRSLLLPPSAPQNVRSEYDDAYDYDYDGYGRSSISDGFRGGGERRGGGDSRGVYSSGGGDLRGG